MKIEAQLHCVTDSELEILARALKMEIGGITNLMRWSGDPKWAKLQAAGPS